MAHTIHSLGIDRMSREQRIALVLDIWDTIAAEPAPPSLSDAQRQELQRRIQEDEACPDEIVPWDQVKSKTLARLKP